MMIVNSTELVIFLQNRTEEDLNEMLDQRDSREFEQYWKEAWDSVNPIDRAPETEQVFLAVSETTEQHEIASYIADDIDLIHTARSKNYSSDFLQWLQESYAKGQFPISYPSA